MRPLVAVDWGTSALRAARLGPAGEVLEERSSPQGILQVPPGGFPETLDRVCADWLSAEGTLCLISGMAGSRQGWIEAAYCACPAGFAQVVRQLAWVRPGRVAIVPGLQCEHDGVPDVLRGEEVQVFGALSLLGVQQGLFVLPGTHSKWVQVAGGAVQGFATCMTGEVYALLRQHSILARMLPAQDGPLDADAFVRGVHHAVGCGSLLATAFSTRTLALFDRLPAPALSSYLSGLVIGEELRLQARPGQAVVLVGAAGLTQRYALGLRALGATAHSLGSEATWRGLWALAQSMESTA